MKQSKLSAIDLTKINMGNILSIAKKKKYVVFISSNYDINIWGIRANTHQTTNYDDILLVFRLSDEANIKEVFSPTHIRKIEKHSAKKKNWIIDIFSATTDPSDISLITPINKKGTAAVVPGQYRALWRKGLHKGDYPALVQHSNVSVYRDNNKDKYLDKCETTIDTGMFGINCHRASKWKIVDTIGLYSAGCQVLKSVKDFENIFLPLIDKSIGEGFKTFTYTLIMENDLYD